MTAVGLKRTTLADRPPDSNVEPRLLSAGMTETEAMDFVGYRPAALLFLAGTDDAGRSLGIVSAWDAGIVAVLLDHLLRDLTLKFLGGTLVAEDPDNLDAEYDFAGSGGVMTLLDTTNSYVDSLGGPQRR